ncbi:MAG: hypothetical protein U9M98_02805 [Patescibacteria group bacterium]|nr:hypothetical protein [Patescibacteria group bacterium]
MSEIRFFSRLLIGLSILGVIFATIGSFFQDIWLASTQWLLISAVLVGFSVYVRMEE